MFISAYAHPSNSIVPTSIHQQYFLYFRYSSNYSKQHAHSASSVYTSMWFPFMPAFGTPRTTDPIFTIIIDIFSSSKCPSSASECCPPYTMSMMCPFVVSLLSFYTELINILVTTILEGERVEGRKSFSCLSLRDSDTLIVQ